MKKYIYLALIMFGVFAISATSYAKDKGTPSAAAQIKDVASSTGNAIKDGVSGAATAVGNAIDTGKQMVKEGVHVVDTSSNFRLMYNDVKGGIAGLASALKVGAEHVYIVLCKQQVVKAVSDLILILLLFGLAYWFYRLARNTYNSHLKMCGYDPANAKDSAYRIDLDDSAKGVASVILGIVAVALCIAGIGAFAVNYIEMITGFVNPEYGAMSTIMDFAKQAVGK